MNTKQLIASLNSGAVKNNADNPDRAGYTPSDNVNNEINNINKGGYRNNPNQSYIDFGNSGVLGMQDWANQNGFNAAGTGVDMRYQQYLKDFAAENGINIDGLDLAHWEGNRNAGNAWAEEHAGMSDEEQLYSYVQGLVDDGKISEDDATYMMDNIIGYDPHGYQIDYATGWGDRQQKAKDDAAAALDNSLFGTSTGEKSSDILNAANDIYANRADLFGGSENPQADLLAKAHELQEENNWSDEDMEYFFKGLSESSGGDSLFDKYIETFGGGEGGEYTNENALRDAETNIGNAEAEAERLATEKVDKEGKYRKGTIMYKSAIADEKADILSANSEYQENLKLRDEILGNIGTENREAAKTERKEYTRIGAASNTELSSQANEMLDDDPERLYQIVDDYMKQKYANNPAFTQDDIDREILSLQMNGFSDMDFLTYFDAHVNAV